MVAAAMVAGGAIALSYYTLKRLLSATKISSTPQPEREPGQPAWYIIPAAAAHTAIVTAVSSLSYNPYLGMTPDYLRAAILAGTTTLSIIQHGEPYLEPFIPRAWMKTAYTIAGYVSAAGVPLHFCSYYAIFSPFTATALVLANGAYGAIFGALTQWATGEELDTSMDGIGNHLHRSPHWWTHAVGDILAGVFNCFLLALLPPEASTAYLGWLGLR